MKQPLLSRFLLLFILCAGTAGCDSEEEPIILAQPDVQPKSVVQIKEIADGYRGTHNFTYDEQGRITEYIRIDSIGRIVNKFYQRYFFRGNAATVIRRYEGSSALDIVARLHLDQWQRTTSVDWQQMTRRMYYDANGYFIERPSDNGWIEYLYTAAAGGFNLTECNVYAQRTGNTEQQPVSSEKRFYSEIVNNLSIDFTYFLAGTVLDLYDQDLALSMVNMLGRRSINLPDKREVINYTADGEVENTFSYEYQLNANGYITQVNVLQTPGNYLTTFRVSY